MDKMLMKLMEKKKGEGKLPKEYKDAKMDVLSRLHKEMGSMIGEDLKGLKGMEKVTVAAPDKESLKEGLDKAEELLGGESESSELCPECGMSHGEEKSHEMSESGYEEEMSLEDIDQQIQKLQELKKQKLLG